MDKPITREWKTKNERAEKTRIYNELTEHHWPVAAHLNNKLLEADEKRFVSVKENDFNIYAKVG